MKYIFGTVFKQIEVAVMDKFGFSKIPKLHKLAILTDFRNFRQWMKTEMTDIMKKCIKYYLDVDKDLEIGFYEIYVIYVHLVIKIQKNVLEKKKKDIHYNSVPRALQSEIALLYYHYGNFATIS
jgi:hypothetical protein